MKPREGLVSKDVAKLIIQKVTRNTDFKLDGIPEIEVNATVLSLYLSRLYLKKGSQDTITAEMVDQFSEYIIKDYYEESIAGIPEDEIEKLEDALITYDGKRDNDSLNNLIHEDEKGRIVSKKTINQLVEESKLLRRFSYQGDIRLEFMHDTLCPIINERIKQRKASKLQEEEKAKIRREEELKRQEIERKAEEEKQRIKDRNRNRWLYLAAFLLGSIILAALLKQPLLVSDYSRTYANFTTVNGWPVGIEEIEPGNMRVADSLIVYYRLTRKGRLNKNPFYKVEVISAFNNKPTTNKFIESPAVGLWNAELSTDARAKAFAELQKQTAFWIYTSSDQESNTLEKCTAYGIESTKLYSVQYSRDNITGFNENKYVQWAVYYDNRGKLMIISDNGIDRMRQTVNNGTVTSCMFFSMLGVPQQNERGAYGYEYIFNDKTHLLQKKYRLDKFGKKIKEAPITYLDYKYGRTKKTSLYDVLYPEPRKVVKKYKSYSDTLAFYPDGKLKLGSFHPDINRVDSIISFSYDKMERPVIKRILSNGKIFYSEVYSYNGKNKEIKKIEDGNNYSERYTFINDSTTILELFENGVKFTLSRLNEKGDSLNFHKCIISKHTNPKYIIESKEYFDIMGNLIKQPTLNNGLNPYSKFITYKDPMSKNIVFVYYYNDKDEIKKSEMFEYDTYGNLTAKAVAGIDTTAVRCPKWSWDDLCCYKMQVLSPFYSEVSASSNTTGFYVLLRGINEFNENSLIILYGNEYNSIAIDERPMEVFINEGRAGYSLSETKITRCNMSKSAFFVHILSKKGTFYSAGLKDGDIIISINGRDVTPTTAKQLENYHTNKTHLVIARANPNNNNYVIKPFTVPAGDPQIHTHQMELTTEELTRLNYSLK